MQGNLRDLVVALHWESTTVTIGVSENEHLRTVALDQRIPELSESLLGPSLWSTARARVNGDQEFVRAQPTLCEP
jgi:hypothetical protein